MPFPGIVGGRQHHRSDKPKPFLRECFAGAPVQQQSLQSDGRFLSLDQAQAKTLAPRPKPQRSGVRWFAGILANELKCLVNRAGLSKRNQERFISMLARLADHSEFAARSLSKTRTFNCHLNPLLLPVGDQAGQDQDIAVVRVLLQVGLMGTGSQLLVFLVIRRFALVGITFLGRWKRGRHEQQGHETKPHNVPMKILTGLVSSSGRSDKQKRNDTASPAEPRV